LFFKFIYNSDPKIGISAANFQRFIYIDSLSVILYTLNIKFDVEMIKNASSKMYEMQKTG